MDMTNGIQASGPDVTREPQRTKLCTKCGRELPIDSFNRKASSKDGLQYWCKDCIKKRRTESAFGQTVVHSTGKSDLRLAGFTSRELMHELVMRGYKGELRFEQNIRIG